METVCHKQLIFESLFSKEVIADFEGDRITSDAGGAVYVAKIPGLTIGLNHMRITDITGSNGLNRYYDPALMRILN